MSGKHTEQESLQPQEERIIDSFSYLCMWLGGGIAISTFAVGSSLMGVLSLFQVVVALLVGTTIIAVVLVFNGKAGNKYGIPYPIHLRSSFGIQGAKIPGIIRAFRHLYGLASRVGLVQVLLMSSLNSWLVLTILLFVLFFFKCCKSFLLYMDLKG